MKSIRIIFSTILALSTFFSNAQQKGTGLIFPSEKEFRKLNVVQSNYIQEGQKVYDLRAAVYGDANALLLI